mmetsp:Transcript_2736/g.7997  ORF Transcript_2736/g.7997 Transcript_2736/m.7997 type:complete len:111 (+) Transcript_2736:1373-1705(+)|eukprot:scaffold41479_cov36-Tisochrysis_lutea.AAC.3
MARRRVDNHPDSPLTAPFRRNTRSLAGKSFANCALPICNSFALQVDMAFELFETDEHGRVSAKELRRIFCESGGAAFNAEEFEEMLEDLGISNDGHIAMQELRNHTSFQT